MWDEGDVVDISLTRGSPTLVASGFSPADVLRIEFGPMLIGRFPASDFALRENDNIDALGLQNPAFPVTADSFGVAPGILASGGLAELQLSDNQDLRIFRDSSTVAAVTRFVVKGRSPTTTPCRFDFVLEGSCVARSNVVQQIELFNYLTSSFEVVDIRNANRSPAPDLVVTASATGDLSRFVDPTTGEIQARVRYRGDVNRLRFSSNTDQAIWIIAD